MRRRFAVSCGLALFALGAAPGFAAQEEKAAAPSLTVAGLGEISAVPDVVEIRAGVVSEASSAEAAVDASSKVMEKLLAALVNLKVAKKDVRTERFDLSPQYRSDPERRAPPRIDGYRVTSRLHVTVRDIRQVGTVLDQLVREGANEIGGISFALADPIPLLDEARRRAVIDARRKAELYSRAAGVKLGRILRLEELEALPPGPVPRLAARAESLAAVPVAPGELDLSIRVTATYALE